MCMIRDHDNEIASGCGRHKKNGKICGVKNNIVKHKEKWAPCRTAAGLLSEIASRILHREFSITAILRFFIRNVTLGIASSCPFITAMPQPAAAHPAL